MTRFAPLPLLLLALVGCGDKDAADSGAVTDGADGATDGTDGATDGTDGATDGTDGTSVEPVEVSGVVVSECDDAGGSPRLDASLASGESISVSHEGFEASCCADLTVTVSQSDGELYMLYTDTADPCDCMCSFDLAYTLAPVPSGEWIIAAAGGVSDTVTVP